jgi:hypothetical protein
MNEVKKNFFVQNKIKNNIDINIWRFKASKYSLLFWLFYS